MVSEANQQEEEEEASAKRVGNSRQTANDNKLNRLNSMAYHSYTHTHIKSLISSHAVLAQKYTHNNFVFGSGSGAPTFTSKRIFI